MLSRYAILLMLLFTPLRLRFLHFRQCRTPPFAIAAAAITPRHAAYAAAFMLLRCSFTDNTYGINNAMPLLMPPPCRAAMTLRRHSICRVYYAAA